MTVDVMFMAKNRLEFTRESFKWFWQNTDWKLVTHFVIYDDGSTDGTWEFLLDRASECKAEIRRTRLGSGLLVANDFVRRSKADIVAKIDNDAVYPPGWLEIGLGVLDRNPALQILGLENMGLNGRMPYSYKASITGDGLWIARGSTFHGIELPVPTDTYYGWGAWVINNRIQLGWLRPSIPVFLLDRVPIEPWRSLSREYVAKGWQRPWEQYKMDQSHLWSWCRWEDA